jgi:predicted transcriptional regulator YheO
MSMAMVVVESMKSCRCFYSMYNSKQTVKTLQSLPVTMPTMPKTAAAPRPRPRRKTAVSTAGQPLSENELLLREGRKIVEALGKMFAPCCEVVLHDLTRPEHAIMAIESPLSGRKVGQPATEMGLARIADPSFPEVVQNYANTFPDGRPVKSTSIGLKNSEGKFVAAICLNLDISLFSSVQRVLEQLTTPQVAAAPVREHLRTLSLDGVRETIESYAARCNQQPRTLSLAQRRTVIAQLAESGLLQLRGAASIAADALGISRASIYNALKEAR